MKKPILILFCFLPIFIFNSCQKDEPSQEIEGWELQGSPLSTRWTKKVDPRAPHPEYPRPQMERTEWLNLNGLWDFAIRDIALLMIDSLTEKILVPFPVESALSGIKRTVLPNQKIWYQRQITLPIDWENNRFLLHFEAVDWETTVWIDGKLVGNHKGGYDPFFFDITDFVEIGQAHQLTVSVWDPTDSGHFNPKGKQVLKPQGIFYTPTSGIWQTVWIEPVPQTHIESFRVYPQIEEESVYVLVKVNNAKHGDNVKVIVKERNKDKAINYTFGEVDIPFEIKIEDAELWTPDNPHLYDLEISVIRNGENIDVVSSYFGMRKIEIGKDDKGITRMLLNDKFVFQNGPLDQGFWPDGLYTPPTEEAMKYDLQVTKDLGFNMLRKHVKVESRRFYHLCDVLGLLVWQDMPSATGFLLGGAPKDLEVTEAHKTQFEFELEQLIRTKFNHPSIIMWVPFNEGWGQYDSDRMTTFVKSIDGTRLVNLASGWTDRGTGDVLDLHAYPAPKAVYPEEKRAAVLGEYGGLGLPILGHLWQKENWGYQQTQNSTEFLNLYEEYQMTIEQLKQDPGLSAVVYTQITDVETETNGLMTYNRDVIKIAPELLRAANEGYHAPQIANLSNIFLDTFIINLGTMKKDATIRYTTNGRTPTKRSKTLADSLILTETTTITAKAFWKNGKSSRVSEFTFTKVIPQLSDTLFNPLNDSVGGIAVQYFEGSWDTLPDFEQLEPVKEGVVEKIDLEFIENNDNIGLVFTGFIKIPKDDIYTFYTASDDGSQWFIGDKMVVDNDGLHGIREKAGHIALAAGYHPFRLIFFEKGGGESLAAFIESVTIPKQEISNLAVFKKEKPAQ